MCRSVGKLKVAVKHDGEPDFSIIPAGSLAAGSDLLPENWPTPKQARPKEAEHDSGNLRTPFEPTYNSVKRPSPDSTAMPIERVSPPAASAF